MADDSTTYQTIPVLHNTKIHRKPIPTKILATNFAVPAKLGNNDQLSSNSMPVAHKGAVLLAKNQVSPSKSEE